MKYLSVCSGIEAASVAWHPLGWTPVAFAEIEKFPSAVLARHYPHVPNFGDMTRFKDWPDADVDVLVGGTPCQSFSVAGLRKGLADPRGNLCLTFLAIADKYRPQWLLWENVPGVLSSDGGRDFGAFLGGLGQLGYGWSYRVLDAQYVRVDGFGRAVPQRRRRVFVVGHLGDWRRAAAVLFERESLQGNTAPRRQAGQRVAGHTGNGATGYRETGQGWWTEGVAGLRADPGGMPENVVAHALRAEGFDTSGMKSESDFVVPVAPCFRAGGNDTGGNRPYGTDVDTCDSLIPSTGDVSHCLNAGGMGRQDYETETLVAHSLRADGFDASEDGTGRGTPLVVAHTIGTQCSQVTEDGTGRGSPLVPVIPLNLQVITRHEALGRGTGFGAGDVGDPAYTLSKTHQHAIAFNGRMDPVNGPVPGAIDTDPLTTCVAFHQNQRAVAFQSGGGIIREIPGNVMATIDSARESRGTNQQRFLQQGWAVRRLTPVECERLQGFPDGYTDIPWRGKQTAPDGPRYKALGNSMAVNCMRWIGRRIELVESLAEAAA